MPPNTNVPAPAAESMRQIAEQLANATNVLITVSNNPSVDQLAACIGLTVALNKQGKHATAVFSGDVPSTLEFLQPEKTIEKNTNSLRDFIISLDKSKADKLRYKVEDEFVKIFITPYRTSLDGSDLAFSQGDFNIDLVITLGVHERKQLDAAIIAHGRILHDAPVISLNTDSIADLGTINWVDTEASSLCEMAADLVFETGREHLDSQIATALLTGMVAETDRFGNEKARPHTMSISGMLMAAGASTQLISNKLDEPVVIPQHEDMVSDEPSDELPAMADGGTEAPAPRNDGTIEIDHSHDDDIIIDEHGQLAIVEDKPEEETEEPAEEVTEEPQAEESKEDVGQRDYLGEEPESAPAPESKLVLDPPQLGGQLTANSIPEHQQYAPAIDPLGGGDTSSPLLDHAEPTQESTLPELPSLEETAAPEPEAPEVPEEPKVEEAPFDQNPPEKTLSEIEQELANEEAKSQAQGPVPEPPSVDDALADVQAAMNSDDNYKPEPISALGATDVGLDLGHDPMEQIRAQEAIEQPSEEKKDSGNTPPPVPPPFNPGA